MISESVSMAVTPFSSILDLSTNLGVVGSATPGGWGNADIPDLPFYTTATADIYVAYVALGNVKSNLEKIISGLKIMVILEQMEHLKPMVIILLFPKVAIRLQSIWLI